MSKIRNLKGGGQIFYCPGCKTTHAINQAGWNSKWTYNGDPEKPTINPSIKVTYEGVDANQDDAPPDLCHSFVRDGMIQFLGDCTHALKNQTVEIPDWPYAPGSYWGVAE
jgi:hypothetical protein